MSLRALEWKWGTGVASAHIDGTEVLIDKWNHETLPQPSQSEVDQAVADWEASVAAGRALSNVITRRKAEYGPVEDQLDMQYWDSVNGTSTWEDHISAVKAKHPKPE